MKSLRITSEQLIYILAFGLALGIRVFNLGSPPLADQEALLALQSLDIAQGKSVVLGSQPGYVMLTGLTVFLLGHSDSLARFWPAIFGALIIPLPYLFRHRIGRRTAIILAIGLALDPGLIARSRVADGSMLAITFGILCLASWLQNRPVLAGFFGGMGLLAGPFFIKGAIGIGVAWLIYRLMIRTRVGFFLESEDPSAIASQGQTGGEFRKMGGALVATILLAGTLFFRFPQGLGGLANAIPSYLQGWFAHPSTSTLNLGLALLIYQPLAVIFGLIGGFRALIRRNTIWLGSSLWMLAILFLTMVYPARQVADLTWAMIPIWLLAASELSRYLDWDWDTRPILFIQAAVVVVLMSFVWLNLASLTHVSREAEVYSMRQIIIFGAIGLTIVITWLVAMGWSSQVAWQGLVTGISLGLSVYMVAVSWHIPADEYKRAQELWFPQPTTVQTDLLLQSVGDLSEWNTGRRDGLEIAVYIDSPSLRWALRHFKVVQYPGQVENPDLKPIAISSQLEAPYLAAEYRGTDFLFRVSPAWTGVLPADRLKWIIFRDAQIHSEYFTLWIRDDLFLERSDEGPSTTNFDRKMVWG